MLPTPLSGKSIFRKLTLHNRRLKGQPPTVCCKSPRKTQQFLLILQVKQNSPATGTWHFYSPHIPKPRGSVWTALWDLATCCLLLYLSGSAGINAIIEWVKAGMKCRIISLIDKNACAAVYITFRDK